MIDLHSHVLPSLDDGAASLDEAVSICRAALDDGTTILAGTPHVRFDYPTTPEEMAASLDALRGAAKQLPIEIVGGGEIALDQLGRGFQELRAFGLAGNPDVLLIETPYFGWPEGLIRALRDLRRAGIVPVLAHPERNHAVQLAPDRIVEVIEAGALVQLTASAVDGRFGEREQNTALRLIWAKQAHLIASDAHAPSLRKVGLRDAAEVVGHPDLARWLTHDLPEAIVRGTPLPPRPSTPRRLFPRLLRRR
jgi:protein-tyrosine phosphatase